MDYANQNPLQTDDRPIAALRAVVRNYGSKRAVDHVDLEIRRGEVLALLGPNGAGKTTAISMLLGLQVPDSGHAELFGQTPDHLAARQRIGVMLQAAQLPDLLSVGELLELTASYYPRPRPIAETIRLAGLEAITRQRYGKLSGGQQRRVQFALAICGRPELIFLDEPTTGLDLEARETLWATIRAEVANGCSVVLTTHYLEEAEALADRVTVMAQGKVVAEGSIDSIRARVGRRQVRARTSVSLEVLHKWPGVDQASRDGNAVLVATSNPEALLRQWLAADPDLCDLEVRRAGLAEAFVELTRQSSADIPAVSNAANAGALTS